MSDFQVGASLDVSIAQQSLRSARSDLQSLGDVEVDVASQASSGAGARPDGGASSMLTGGAGPTALLEDSMNELVGLATERNVMLSEMLDATERDAATDGGGGGGVGATILAGLGVRSLLGGLAGVSLASLVTSVSVGTLIKGSLAAGTLITGGVIAKNLIEGDVSASAIIDPINNLGDFITGPVPLPDLIETGVGLGAFIAGGASIASFLTGTSITALVSGASITGLLSGASVTSLLTGSVAATSLVATTGAAALTAGAVIGGTIWLNDRVEGEVSISDYLASGDMAGEGTPKVPRGPDGDVPLKDEFVGPRYIPPEDRAVGDEEAISNIQQHSIDTQRVSSGGTGDGTKNAARDRSSKTTVENNPTFNLDVSELRRTMEQNRRELERKIRDIERQLGGVGGRRGR